MDVAVAGIDLQGGLERLRDPVLLALLAIQVGQIDVGRHEHRLESEGGAILLLRRVAPSEPRVERAEIHVGLGAIGVERLRLAILGDGPIERGQLLAR